MHKIILFIKKIFNLNTDNVENIQNDKTPSTLFNTTVNQKNHQYSTNNSSFNISQFNTAPTTIDATLASQQVNSGLEHQKVMKYIEKNQRKLKYDEIINVVHINIYYLEQLHKAMEKTIYIEEQTKVNNLLEQSKNCLKLLQHINTSKIFYQNTINFIITHAIQVGTLTEHLKDIDIYELLNS